MKIGNLFLSFCLLFGLASCAEPEEMDQEEMDQEDDTGEVDLRWSPPWQPPIGDILCGNSVPNPGEECDDGNNKNDDFCTQGCKWAFCGDGYVQVGIEQCDDGNLINNDGCTNECKKYRITDFQDTLCGNGLPDLNEECDDGNSIDNDACTNQCKQN